MSRDFDEISRAIGALQNSAETTAQQTAAMWKRLDEIKSLIIQQGAAHSSAVAETAALKKHINEDIMPTIREMNALKQRGIGMLATVGLVAGTLGLLISRVFDFAWAKVAGH